MAHADLRSAGGPGTRQATGRHAETSREPLLAMHDIQGNILDGFNKDHQVLMALKIRDLDAALRWLRRIVPFINSAAEVHQFNTLFRLRRARLGYDPPGLVATWANVAFSHDGLALLTSQSDAEAIPDVAFRIGLPLRASGLGDPIGAGETDPTKLWVVGGTGRVPDVLLIVAGDDPRLLAAAVRQLRPRRDDGRATPRVIWRETGMTLPDLPGHEHFGFKDGVSQPGVRGLVSQDPDVYFTPRLLEDAAEGEIEFARPGQPLIWPGQFVLGYASQNRSKAGSVPAPELNPHWIKNGSFLVFRRLRQDVAAFTAFVRATAAALTQAPEFSGMTPERLGALLVGRWASGAPVSRSPRLDCPGLATDALSNNDFLFTIDTPPPRFRPGWGAAPGPFPAAIEDALGLRCPRAAHIRKMNPRDQDSELGDRFDTLTRRILRRGIPFGPPLADPSADAGAERGLHFLCYQSSIEDQFETLQRNWANAFGSPQPGGHDLIIGQDRDHPREVDLLAPDGSTSRRLTAPRQWVVPTGGGYFFAPSISAIRDVLCRADELA